MEQGMTEKHPWAPFLPSCARILMLGSFPPPRARWSMEFYYPNLQNDMWRIFGLLFFGNKDHFLTERKKAFDRARVESFAAAKGIALIDVATEVVRRRGNASDQFLEIVSLLDLDGILRRIPGCEAVVTTGQKATDALLSLTGAAPPPMGGHSSFPRGGRDIRLYRMPSSSRAYPKPLEEKAGVYRKMFQELKML